MAALTTRFGVPRWFVERAVVHYDLSPADRLTFMSLCSGRKRGEEVLRISVADLEAITGLSRTQVKTSIAYLRKIELIKQVEPARGRRPAGYVIPEHMPWPEMVFPAGPRAVHDGMGWKRASS